MKINSKSYYGLINDLDDNDKRIPDYVAMYNEVGYEPTETWNLDHTISKFIEPRLAHFVNLKNGYPADMTEEEWDTILDKMLTCFRIINENGGCSCLEKEQYEKVEEGLQLFAKHYMNLWW